MTSDTSDTPRAQSEWSKETYEQSISSRCWYYTPYDGGQWNDLVAVDDELRQIVAMENRLKHIPDWAGKIVASDMYYIGACGHYLFPQTFLEVIDAIGKQTPAKMPHGCFTVERTRKQAALDYCFCLDAWLAGATADDAASQLTFLGFRKLDWSIVCADLWHVLGEQTELKRLLVERLLHAIRYAIRFNGWDDDAGRNFCCDEYLGSRPPGQAPTSYLAYYETPPFALEWESPRVQRIDARLTEICPDWHRARDDLLEWWLCAPKAFRFLERKLWNIGKGVGQAFDSERKGVYEPVPHFLQSRDTYPDFGEAAVFWRKFLQALDAWWQQEPAREAVAEDVYRRLSRSTATKRWLVRLYARRLRRLEENNEQFTQLIRPDHSHTRGTNICLSDELPA